MFDIVSKFNGKPLLCTRELMQQTMQSAAVVETCQAIAKLVKTKISEVERQIAATSEPGELADLERSEKALWEEVARLKKRLPAFCFQAHYTDGRRRNKSAQKSGLCMFDIDDLQDARATYEESADRMQALGVALVHITPSTRGLRYVFRTPEGMDIAKAQQWFAEQLGVKQFDSCTKDLARISFAVPEDYVLMMDEQVLFGENQEESKKSQKSQVKSVKLVKSQHSDGEVQRDVIMSNHSETHCYDTANEASDGKTEGKDEEVSGKTSAAESSDKSAAESSDELNFRGIPFTLIIDRLLLAMGVDGNPVEGERNTTLYNLVRQLRYICDFSQARLMQVLPRWGMSEEEVAQTVQSALSTVRRANLPPHLSQTLHLLMAQQNAIQGVEATGDASADDAQSSVINPKAIHFIPEHLPRLLHLLTKSYPEEYRAAILLSALPILGTLATRARAIYFDGAEHSPSFLTCIVAPQASGKSCTRKLVDLLLGRLQRQDNGEREKERRWLDEKKARKNSKQQPEDPRARIRIVPATISNAMLFKRLDCSEGEHLFTYAEEIDTLSKGRKSGTWSQKDDIMRQAFDNSICGQDYMSDNSWSAMVRVFYNTLTCGTPVAVRRYYNDVEGGLVSRVCFSQLPDMLGASMPVFGSLSAEEEAEVRQWADKLMAIGNSEGEEEKRGENQDASGAETSVEVEDSDDENLSDRALGKLPTTKPVYFEIPRVKQAIWDWMEARRLEYLETQENPALDIFRRRAAVIGFRAGLLGMLLCDGKESDEAVDFATWVAGYVLKEQLNLFGEEMNRLMLDSDELSKSTSNLTFFQPLLSILPNEFTAEQLATVSMQAGYKSPIKQVIFRWKHNGLIEKKRNKYIKLKA
jgi:hypothetical protein